MLLIDVIIAIIAVALFYLLNLTGFLPIITIIGAAVLVHFASLIAFQAKDKKDEEKKKLNFRKEQVNRRINDLKKLSENVPDEVGDLLKSFVAVLANFNTKKKILLEIMTDDESLKRDLEDSEDYLVGLSERLDVKIKILKVIDKYDYHFETIVGDIEAIVSTGKEIITGMDDLLVEASKSDDDFDSAEEKKERIKASSNRMKQVRERNKSLLDKDPDEGFLLSSSGSSNLGI